MANFPRMETLRSAADLGRAGLISSADRLQAIEQVAERYAVAVTPALAALIDPNDPNDPIARQFLPDSRELHAAPGESADPIGDVAHMPVKGIVHRYPDRVLLKPTHACAVYCRFCFRREMVGPGGDALSPTELDAAIAYIAQHEAIWETILTGGDPLILAPRRMADIIAKLSAIEHLGVIRIHSRAPIAEPECVTSQMMGALETHKAVFLVLHVNHPRELTDAVARACRMILKAGIPILSQTVLLKGINDDPAVLEALFRRLAALRIKPYQLHHADMAPGTGHFRTTLAAGQALVKSLQGRVSGICQPHYVLDLPGGHGKVPVAAPLVVPAADSEHWWVEDYTGMQHLYPHE